MRCATCKRTFTNERSWERIDKGADLPDGHLTHDLDFCSLTCVWVRYPGDAVQHG
jgi:hypothetical protein